ncbi:MAG: hypothetical protein KAS32_04550 [Candidatus Peribacteraceae bacterium]|nr:hypothetical protein [Candidatus Peribacteraceae bacterium]
MKTIEKYVDEISGREFKTVEEAIKSEKKNGGIKKLFSFWVPAPKDEHCSFANGGWCYQRADHEVLKLTDALLKAIKDYEPWIAGQYESDGGIQRDHLGPGYIIGRYLQDGGSELYSKYCILSEICPKCFRQWGQLYHASHCTCDSEPKPLT